MNNAPRIWVPKVKILEPRDPIAVPVRLRGLFKMEAIRPDGRVRMLADWFPNLITDAGLNAIGTTSDYMNACRVGTGSTPPSNGDTAMAAFLVGTINRINFDAAANASPPYHGRATYTFQFATGAAAGNLAEVGMASSNFIGGVQFSRALILDGDGDPTTITVLSDEILQVTYQLQEIVPSADVPGTVTIAGVDYDTVTRASRATAVGQWVLGAALGVRGGPTFCVAYDGTIGAITASPSGSTATANSESLGSYSDSSYRADTTFGWNLATANFGGAGIRAIRFDMGQSSQGLGSMQVSFANDDSPALGIPKDNTQVLSLVCRHTWARGVAI